MNCLEILFKASPEERVRHIGEAAEAAHEKTGEARVNIL